MSIALHIGDCRAILPTLPDASVHCVVTSPPYWGLRDYGTATWEGGDPGCAHIAPPTGGRGSSGMNSGEAHERWIAKLDITNQYRATCGHCGAIRIDAQLGLEPDFNAYVANMVGVFRAVRRVLRDDGTCWINLGDSYASGGRGGGANGSKQQTNIGSLLGSKTAPVGLKPKDLCGIPWRVAFALQADGWYLRQDIIWSKANPMPESVTDRCTKAHEYLFLLSKRERYYYDAEAIAEASVIGAGASRNITPGNKGAANTRNDGDRFGIVNDGTRNKRSVWEVTTQPFSEAHFATFPPALIEPCIKAGTSEKGCCGRCGKPWVRQVDRSGGSYAERKANGIGGPYNGKPEEYQTCGQSISTTVGWSPSCACGADPVPCTVLDPFAGAGTTGLVADRLQRNAILIELNPAYAAMSSNRIKNDAPLFVEMAT